MKFLTPLFLSALLFFSGCLPELYEKAPSGPSRNLNTWLLGVWEAKFPDGKLWRVTMGPGGSLNYAVYIEEMGRNGKPGATTACTAWLARVGQASLLILEVPTPDGNRYAVLGYQLLSPLSVRTRPVLVEDKTLSPFQFRVAIRRQFRDGTLLPAETGVIWTKISEVYWPPEGMTGPQPLQPLRNLPRAIEIEKEEIRSPQ